MKKLLRLIAVVATSAGVIVGTTATARAATPTPSPTPPSATGKQIQYCTTLLMGPKNDSREASRTCSTDRSAAKLLAPATYTALVTFFEDANYVGYYDTIYGQYGPCDAAGYGFSDLSGAEFAVNGISSYYYFNSCNTQGLYTGTYYGGVASNTLYGDRAYVGDTWNDNTYSMRVWHT